VFFDNIAITTEIIKMTLKWPLHFRGKSYINLLAEGHSNTVFNWFYMKEKGWWPEIHPLVVSSCTQDKKCKHNKQYNT